jgi:hypothetical protein
METFWSENSATLIVTVQPSSKEFQSKKTNFKLNSCSDTESLSLALMISHFIVEQLKLPLIGELYTRSQEPICV